jgi:uncharacterized protein (TIGR02246 family)
MQNDEEAIRKLVDSWLAASQAGDLATVLTLMADDVIFMVPGKDPFGKDQFVTDNEKMKEVKIEAESDIQEIKVLGDWAWMRNFLKVTFTPPGGSETVKSGHILTILQKRPNGNWVIKRDANLMT